MKLSILKNFDPNNVKVDKKSYKNFFICYIGYVTIKDWRNVNIDRVNSLYFIFSKVNGYFIEINKNRYLARVPTNESKEIIKAILRTVE